MNKNDTFNSFKGLQVLKDSLKNSAQSVAMSPKTKHDVNLEAAQKILRQLKAKYPIVFNPKKPLPLALGISKEIVKDLPDCVPASLKLALTLWSKKAIYLQAVISGVNRHNLDGSIAGVIQESEKEYSQKMLDRKQEKLKNKPAENHWVYILECSNGAFYTGWTNNLEKRYRDHCEGNGAKYTRSFKPVKIAQQWQFSSKSLAMQAEAQIKKLTLKEKKKIIADSTLFLLESNIK